MRLRLRPLRPLERLEPRDVPAVTILFDYSFDSSGFFADPARRATLERAGADLGNRITTPLAAVAPAGGDSWSASFFHPATGQSTTVTSPTVAANTIRVYVGARPVTGDEAGFGGPGGYAASGSQGFLDTLAARWPGGFPLWGGSVAFDATRSWYFGASAAGIARTQTDFYSVAVHELGHVLGIGTSRNWSSFAANGSFTGPAARAANGGPVRLSSDGAHWAAGTRSDGRPAAMGAELLPGTRWAFTPLDFAALRDVGWAVASSDTPVSPPAPPPVDRVPVGTPPTGAATVVLSGLADGSAQGFELAAGNRLSPIGAAVVPFPGFTGVVRSAVADFDGDKVPDTAFGTGAGTAARVRVISGATGADIVGPTAVLDGFTGGVFLAAGDVDRDGRAELAVSADAGGGNRVSVFRVTAGRLAKTADFFAFGDARFRGGSRIALGDVNRDGAADLIVGAGVGGSPRVAIYDGKSLAAGTPRSLVPDFFALDPNLRSGVFVTAADFDADGFADVAYSVGATGGPRVRVVSGAALAASPGVDAYRLSALADFFAFDPADRTGLRLVARDLNADGRAELVATTGNRTAGAVRVFSLADLQAGGGTAAAQTPLGTPSTADGIYLG